MKVFLTLCLKILKLLTSICLILWPVIIYFSRETKWSIELIVFILFVCLIRVFLWVVEFNKNRHKMIKTDMMDIISVAILLLLICVLISLLLTTSGTLYLYYPALVNGILFCIFFGSLFTKMPIIERIARMTQKELPLKAIWYTRTVTKVWVWFFIINGLICAFVALQGNLKIWVIYTNIISYGLIAGLMGIEYLFRLRMQKILKSELTGNV